MAVYIMILTQSFLKSRLILFTALNLTQSLFLNVGSLVYSIYALVVFINSPVFTNAHANLYLGLF